MTWNAPEYHLLVNHFSVMAAPIALAIFIVGWALRNRSVENTGFVVFIVSAIGAFASDQTGDAAADFVKELPGFERELIHAHAGAADYAVILCYVAGVFAALLLWMSWKRRHRFEQALRALLVVVALMGIAALARTAHLGGLIRHTEIRATGTG